MEEEEEGEVRYYLPAVPPHHGCITLTNSPIPYLYIFSMSARYFMAAGYGGGGGGYGGGGGGYGGGGRKSRTKHSHFSFLTTPTNLCIIVFRIAMQDGVVEEGATEWPTLVETSVTSIGTCPSFQSLKRISTMNTPQ